MRSQAGYRVAVAPSDRLRAGTTVPEIELTEAIKALESAGANCDRYACVGPKSGYTIRFGVAPTTTELVIEAGRVTDLDPLWANLGSVGKDAAGLVDSGRYAVGVVGGYLASVSERDGNRVIVIADDAGLLRGDLPDGRKPGAPSVPPR